MKQEMTCRQAIDHLGSPQKVAQDIKSGLKGEYFYTENGAESAASDTESKTPAFMWRRKRKATEQSICCKVVILELVGRSEHDHEG